MSQSTNRRLARIIHEALSGHELNAGKTAPTLSARKRRRTATPPVEGSAVLNSPPPEGLGVGSSGDTCLRFEHIMNKSGWMHGTWPFACLKADAESVDFRLLFKHYTLARDDVVEFSRYRYLFTRGLRIVHRRNELPKLLLFYSLDGYETLMQLLQKLGYTVKETCSAV